MTPEQLFLERRFDPKTHLGLGDIRLTLADQDAIIEMFERLKTRIDSPPCSLCGGTRQVPSNWTEDGKNACPKCTDYR